MNYISGIDAARTYQLAFSAHHAFCNFFGKAFCFASLDQQIDFPWIKVGQLSGRTRGRTASTTNAPFERWFVLSHKFGDREIIVPEVYLSPF